MFCTFARILHSAAPKNVACELKRYCYTVRRLVPAATQSAPQQEPPCVLRSSMKSARMGVKLASHARARCVLMYQVSYSKLFFKGKMCGVDWTFFLRMTGSHSGFHVALLGKPEPEG